MQHYDFYMTVDAIAILATALMLYMTEKQTMTHEKPEPLDFAESVAGHANETQEQRVHAMLDDAQTNGYEIDHWSVDDIVADLMAFADTRDDETEDVIRPHVITWKANRSKPT